MLFVKIK